MVTIVHFIISLIQRQEQLFWRHFMCRRNLQNIPHSKLETITHQPCSSQDCFYQNGLFNGAYSIQWHKIHNGRRSLRAMPSINYVQVKSNGFTLDKKLTLTLKKSPWKMLFLQMYGQWALIFAFIILLDVFVVNSRGNDLFIFLNIDWLIVWLFFTLH